MSHAVNAKAALITAPASGSGKTLITAALARLAQRQGVRVRLFKCGPDFLDPTILARAAGEAVDNIDLWMTGTADAKRRLYQAATEADVILVEGVMGLFDGNPSSADIAAQFGLPVVPIIDAGALAQTFGAILHGLASYRADIRLTGAIANRVAGEAHRRMLSDSLKDDTLFLAATPHDAMLTIPDRHLGLYPADEIVDLDHIIDRASDCLDGVDFDRWPTIAFVDDGADEALPQDLAGTRIAVARDGAFSFLYPANIRLLESMGGQITYFSPLSGDDLPKADAVWLPGGYPELYARELASNTRLKASLRSHHASRKPIYAECGGLLYLLDRLTTAAGDTAEMAGILPGHGQVHETLKNIGFEELAFGGGTLRGHSFHHSTCEVRLPPVGHARRADDKGDGEALYVKDGTVASYVHLYFPSCPKAAADLFLATDTMLP